MSTAPGPSAAGPPPPSSPPVGAVDPRAIRPRRSMFLVALGIFVVALVAGIVVVVLGVRNADLGLQRVSGGSSGTVTLSAPDRTLYSSRRVDRAGATRCRFTGPGSVTTEPAADGGTVTIDGTTWYGVADLHATRTGTYQVSCPAVRGRLAVAGGVGAAFGVVGTIFLGIGIVLLGVLIAGIMSLVIGVRRTSSRNRLQPTVRPGAGPPPGAPSGAPSGAPPGPFTPPPGGPRPR